MANSAQPVHEVERHHLTAKPTLPEPVTFAPEVESIFLQRAVEDPTGAQPREVLALQRLVGNRAVTRLIQTKLTVGPAGDAYEQEADRVAEQVISMPEPVSAPRQNADKVQRQEDEEEIQTKPLVQRQEDEEEIQTKPLVQRQEDEEEIQTKPLVQRQEDEEEIQTKPLVQRQEDEEEIQTKPLVQRQEDEEEIQTKPLVQRAGWGATQETNAEEEEEVQTKPLVQRAGDGSFEASRSVEGRLATTHGTGSPLPGDTRAFMESRFGADFSDVRIHTGAEAAQLSRDLQAQAFTHGRDIYFGAGRYDPGTETGKRLLAHELTHTIQQTGGARLQRRRGRPAPDISRTAAPQIQAQLMTAAEFVALSGTKRRMLISRLIMGASYDKIIGYVEEYEKLAKEDPEGKQPTKRLEVLKDLMDTVEKWYTSPTRQKNLSDPKKKAQDDLKDAAITRLYVQALQERDALLKLGYSGRMKGMQVGLTTFTTTTKVPKWREAEMSTAEMEARAQLEAQKGFFARLGDKIKNFFKYTFGAEFRPEGQLALSPQALTEDELTNIVTMIDKSLEIEAKLRNADPQNPLKALALAFMHLPEQLRPKTPDPEERVVLKAKKQLFLEAIGKERERQQQLTQPQKTTGQKVREFAQTTALKTPGALESVGGFVSGQLEEEGFQKKMRQLGTYAPKLGMNKVGEFGQKMGQLSKELTDKIASISGVVGGFGKVVKRIIEFARGDVKLIRDPDKVKRLKAYDAIKEFIPGIISDAGELVKGGLSIAGSFGAVIPDAIAVGIDAFLALIEIIKSIINGAKRIYRVWQERGLIQEAKQTAQALVGAIKGFKARNVTLALRAGVEIIISALKMVGGILKVIPDPSGGTQTAGLVLSTVGTALSALNTVTQTLQESYRAGVRQEAERQAEAGIQGSAKRVMRESPKYAATALILEAKDGNPVAIKELGVYGITPEMIRTSPVDVIRERLFIEMEEKEDPTTIGQKVKSVLHTVGLTSRV